MTESHAAQIAQAQARAQARQAAEDEAQARFAAVRDAAQAAGNADEAQQTAEFKEWIACRHRTDEAWGQWWCALEAQWLATAKP
jgi:hypothetical protein